MSQTESPILDRLTSIERFHLYDSSDRFPNRITCRLLLQNQIDIQLAKNAYFWLAQRHPILGCSIDQRLRRPQWRLEQNRVSRPTERPGTDDWFFHQKLPVPPRSVPDFRDCLRRAGENAPFMLIRQWLDRNAAWSETQIERTSDRESRAEQTDLQESVQLSEIWLSIHHAYCDGAGGVAIINDWLEIYENLQQGRPATDRMLALDPARFADRSRLGLFSWKFIRNLPFQPIGLFGAAKFIFRKTATFDRPNRVAESAGADVSQVVGAGLTSSGSGHSGAADKDAVANTAESYIPAYVGRWMEATPLAKIQQASREAKHNLNARLLGDFFGSIDRWRNKLELRSTNGDYIRVILPINIREISDRRLSAVNRSSIVQIDRRDIGRPISRPILELIQREIDVIIRWKLDRMFLIFIRLISCSAPLLKHVAQNKKHRGFAVFTNLGQPFRRWEKRLEQPTTSRTKLADVARLVNPNLATESSESAAGRESNAKAESSLRPIEIDFLAPLRHGTPLNVTVALFQNRLRITLHYDPQMVSSAQAEALIDEFVESLQEPIE